MTAIGNATFNLHPQEFPFKFTFSLADTFKIMAEEVLKNPAYVSSPRGRECREIIDYKIVCGDPLNNHFVNAGRTGDVNRYLAKEMMLYFGGRNDAEGFIDASKFWGKLATPDGKINSAYGYMIFVKKTPSGKTQFEWVMESFKKDKDTRQALMFLGSPDYQYDGNPDFTCTLNYHFFIRNNRLDMIVNRRSQDLVLGFTYDAVWEMCLLQALRLELLAFYPELKLGFISWNINSLHIYKENFEMIEKMLEKPFVVTPIPQMFESPILNKNFSNTEPFQKWCLTYANPAKPE